MKAKQILTIAVLLGATAGQQAAAVVVYEPALNALTKASWTKQVADMAMQIKTAKGQLDSARATFDSLNGTRGISNLLKNPTLYNYLPPDVAAALRANGSGMSSAAAVKANLKLLGIEQTGLDPNSAAGKSFTARQDANANYQLLNEQGYQASADRIKQMDALIASIDGATDPMKIQALSVRVAAESALVANEQARLAVLAQMAANSERVREQQNREIALNSGYAPMPAGW